MKSNHELLADLVSSRDAFRRMKEDPKLADVFRDPKARDAHASLSAAIEDKIRALSHPAEFVETR